MSLKKIFASLDVSKTEELEDGTLKVYGYASSETEDSDGETITADAMKAALPDYLKWGAVREMHQAKAAGTAIEAEVQDDGKTWFGAHVVDSEAVKKVKTGVYKGFSIGGKVTERDELNKAIIKGLKLIEVSLVDRPANPEAVLTMYKAETVEDEPAAAVDQLAELLNKGEITPEKLLELAKGASNPSPAKGATPDDHTANAAGEGAAAGDEIKKGMYGVSRMADLLQSISYLAQDTQWEAEYEGDNSPLPQQLRDWLSQGAGILKAMAEEEINELLAGLQVATKAAGIDGLAKAGARFSKGTKDALGAIHKAAKEACDHLDKLGYDAEKDDDEGAGKGAKGDDLAKVSAAHADLLKAIGAIGCPEGVVASDFVKAMATERDDLKKRVAELEAKPAPGKALLKAIAKSADAGGVETDDAKKVDPVTDSKGEVNEVATLIKSIHSGKAA